MERSKALLNDLKEGGFWGGEEIMSAPVDHGVFSDESWSCLGISKGPRMCEDNKVKSIKFNMILKGMCSISLALWYRP